MGSLQSEQQSASAPTTRRQAISRTTPVEDLPELLKVEEAAAYLGVGRWLGYELVRTGALPSVRLGRLVRIPRSALRALSNPPPGAPSTDLTLDSVRTPR